MNTESHHADRRIRFICTLGAMLGTVLPLAATFRYQVGLSHDSAVYLGVARNLALGNGFYAFNGDPFVFWPPLYPLLLTPLWQAGVPLRLAAWLLSAGLMGATVGLTMMLARRWIAPTRGVVAAAGVLALTSIPLWYVSVFAWSEPLYIFFQGLFLWGALSLVRTPTPARLALMMACVALACLTRYIGVSLAFAGALLLLLYYPGPLARRLRATLLFLMGALAPLALWIGFNRWRLGSFFGTRPPAEGSVGGTLVAMGDVLLTWFVPPTLQRQGWLLALVGFVCLALLARLLHSGREPARARFLTIIYIVAGSYVVFLAGMSAGTAVSPPDNRLLVPLAPLVLLLLLDLLHTLAALRLPRIPKLAPIGVGLGAALLLLHPLRTLAIQAQHYHRWGVEGLGASEWHDRSALLAFLRAKPLPPLVPLRSNDPALVSLYEDRNVGWAPTRSEVAMRSGPTEASYLIWFDLSPYDFLAPVETVAAIAEVKEVARFSDGAVYLVQPKQQD